MKYHDKLKEFLDSELGDLPYFEKYEISLTEEHNSKEYFDVEITTQDKKTKTLRFRVDSKDIEVDLNDEGDYTVCKDFDWTVKYFWMSLLSWDF